MIGLFFVGRLINKYLLLIIMLTSKTNLSLKKKSGLPFYPGEKPASLLGRGFLVRIFEDFFKSPLLYIIFSKR